MRFGNLIVACCNFKRRTNKNIYKPVDRSSPGPESVQLGVEAALEAGEAGPEALRGGGDLRHLGVEAVHLQHHSRVRQHAAFNADS